jgi:hypothetical protein
MVAIGRQCAAGQGDRRDAPRLPISAEGRVGAAAQHRVGQHNIDRRGGQPRIGFGRIGTHRHLMAEFGQDSSDEIAYSPVRLGQQDSCHRPPPDRSKCNADRVQPNFSNET